jgi:hypothetical protein
VNFETRYLIRWGIPGWIFLLWLSIYLSIVYFNEFDSILQKLELDISKFLGVIVSLAFFGVPIGYLLQQIYFFYHWLRRNERSFDKSLAMVKDFTPPKTWNQDDLNDYFRFEYIWHKELLQIDKDSREYITERYRHFLTTIHGLGALLVSLLFSSAISFIWFLLRICEIGNKQIVVFFVVLIFQGFIFYAVKKSFEYYSKNLIHFQGYFLNALRNKIIKFKDLEEKP